MFGLPKENVRVITKFVGSGFGSKLWPWTHCPLAVAAARHLGKPVKLVLSRKMMFQIGRASPAHSAAGPPRRDDGWQARLPPARLRLSPAMLDGYHEDCGEATPFHYSVPNLRVHFGRARRNVGSPHRMRGPGAVPGLYATESAMNELADQLKIDPVKLRMLNEPKIDESLGIPFSSRHYLECSRARCGKVRLVASATPEVGSMKRDGLTLGWGMAGARGSRRDFRPKPVSSCAMTAVLASPAERRTSAPAPTRFSRSSLREDRRAGRQSRSCSGRHVTSARPDFRWIDGHRFDGACGVCRGR